MLAARETPTGEWSLEIDGAFDEVRRSLAWIDAQAQALNLSEDHSYALRLCAEELLTNVVCHNKGPCDAGGALRARVTLRATTDRVALTIEDNGVPFDIVNAPSKTADQSLDRIQPGGLGVGLVKRFASKLSYERTPDGNKVVAEFY
jgi:serine/threonine-protein kinase RsbW